VAELTYRVISADSHVIEPPDLWAERVPAEYRDRTPRLVHEATTDRVVCEGAAFPHVGLLAGCYRPDSEQRADGRWDEDVPVGGYDPDARLADLEQDGIDAELLFPTLGLSLYPIEDFDLQWALLRAYNTWLAETFCQPHQDRFRGIAMLLHEDVDRAVAELKRAREIGLSGVMIPAEPGDDDPYWDERFDPLWAASVEYDMPVNLHLATSRKKRQSTGRLPTPGGMLQFFGLGVQGILVDLIHYGLFDRFPELQLVSAENDAGWAAYLMESQDYRWHRLNPLRAPDESSSKREPSHYFHHNISMTFMRDHAAIVAKDIIGVDRMMWGNDFPHQTSTWPNSKVVLDEVFHGQPQEARDAVTCGNVRRLYHF
jgi:predicted TIM-barrel fold metal-dependent hydrolase